jgi:hypothetical protein
VITCHLRYEIGQARRVLPVRVFLLDVLEDVGVGLLLPDARRA